MSNDAPPNPTRFSASLVTEGDKDPRYSVLKLDRTALTRRTSLQLPADLPIHDWQRIGEQILLISDSSAWWIGDWLLFGKQNYADRYKRAIEETSLDYQTLRNYAWIAGKFELSRRRDKLSFQHHVEVAGLTVDQQEHWLSRAEECSWSRNELRTRLRSAANGDGQDHPSRSQLRMNVPVDRMDRWERAAQKLGLDLLDWIWSVLDQAAEDQAAEQEASLRGAASSLSEYGRERA